MRPDLERERALEPDRHRVGALVTLPVAGRRGDRPVAVLELIVAGANPPPAPPRLEQPQKAIKPFGAAVLAAALGPPLLFPELAGVEALQNLVDQDPEALVDGRLL